MRVVTTGLDAPWELTWGPDDRLWVTERRGKRVLHINPRDGTKETLLTVGDAHQSVAQDGLLGLALHADFLGGRGTDYVYLAFTYDSAPGDELARRTAIRRYTYDRQARTLVAPMDVIRGLPAHDDHLGGRLVFGPDGKLYLSIGDQGSNWLQNRCNLNRAQELPTLADVQSQNWMKYQGKILRINLDGSIPGDNPLIDGVRSHILSYGHRNPQGLAFGPGGRLYESEHGPSSDDEVNLIEAGGNYGWPRVAGFRDDKAYAYANWSASTPEPCSTLPGRAMFPIPASVPKELESSWSHPGFKPPVQTFFTVDEKWDFEPRGATIAPSSLDTIVSGRAIAGWNSSVLVPSLLRGLVFRVKLSADGRSASGPPLEYFKSTNRYRDLAVRPDQQAFYIATDVEGLGMNAARQPTRELVNPGAILEFAYAK